jgi:tRNA nucleotidyltransferase (CCA-adding enzyme)
VEKNPGVLLKKSLKAADLDLIQRIADQAATLNMPVYLVGGFVRDLLLEQPVGDFDIVVEGEAAQLARALAKAGGGKVTEHAIFGTARWSFSGSEIDLTTARSEIYEQPGALPVVKFSTIDDDLHRRDFTINAMAIRLDGDHFGKLLDPLGGEDDLSHNLIRVLHPRSFLDDPTRTIRAVRYAERYGFAIVPETLQLFNEDSRMVLSRLSGERLRHEFDLIFEEEKPSQILAHLAELDLLRPVHAALQKVGNQLSDLGEPRAEWGDFKIAEILTMRQTLGWIIWLMPLTSLEIDSIAERLNFPGVLTKAASAAATLFSDLASLADAKPSRWTFYLDNLPLLAVYAVYLREQTPALKEYFTKWRNVRPKTTGDDLKMRGLPPGPEYQKILSRLRAAWLDEEITTQEQELALLEKLEQEK